MPIINYIDERVQLEFGHGDIVIVPGIIEDVPYVAFMESQEPQPIGTVETVSIDWNPSPSETPVKMIFNDIRSIDALITSLIEAKSMAIYK